MRLLAVDDDVEVRDLLVRALERGGHTVVAVSTASEARRILSERAIDVVVLDPRLGTTHATRTSSKAEVADASFAVDRARAELERASQIVRAAEEARTAQNGRYQSGVSSLLELLDAEAIEQNARLERILAARDHVFDGNDDPIGVNNGLLAVCDPALQGGAAKQFACAQGSALSRGTGFGGGEYSEPSLFGEADGEGGASTGWLTTLVPCASGTIIKLRFAIWDTGDFKVDSTALIDRFNWSVEQPTAPSTKPTPVLL